MSQKIIDDQDFTHVKYNGTWLRGGSPQEHDGTVASSTHVNDSFTVSFSGNSIAVYGTIDITSGGVLTNYSIDGASPVQVTSQAGSEDTYNQQFWGSPDLNEGDHTLVVTMVKVNWDPEPSEGTIWFDYFLVIDPDIQPSSTARLKNIGAIVGGVIGGVSVLIFLFLAIFFLRRRNKQNLNHIQPWTNKEGASPTEDIRGGVSSYPTNIGPFPLGVGKIRKSNLAIAPTSTTSCKVVSRYQNPIHLSSASVSATTIATNQLSSSIVSTSTPPSSLTSPPGDTMTSNPASRKRLGPTPGTLMVLQSSSSLLEPAIQHVDSGVRVANMDPTQTPSAPMELPPVYSPV